MKPLALIFGEDQNDTRALRGLVNALLPADRQVDCKPLRDPPILSKGASRDKRKKLAKAIAVAVQHENRRRQVVVVVHRDCDACEDAHKDHANEIRRDLTEQGVEPVIPAVPAWEIETWWMLFPEALHTCRGCWSSVDYSNRNLGKIERSKEVLIRDLRPKGALQKRCPDYSESDSVRIAEEILSSRLCDDELRLKKSGSLHQFYNDLRKAFGVKTAG